MMALLDNAVIMFAYTVMLVLGIFTVVQVIDIFRRK
jgi:hypothetical protein